MRVLVAFYSRTGTAARAARIAASGLRARGVDAEVFAIRERYRLPYPLWLLLSFLPGVGWPIMGSGPDLAAFDGLLLVAPKWTLACPPVESWIRSARGGGKPAALAVACGGFDEDRYAAAYAKKLGRRGFSVSRAVTVKKRTIAGPKARATILGAVDALVEGMAK